MNARKISLDLRVFQRIVFVIAFCSSCISSTEPLLSELFDMKAESIVYKTGDFEIPEILEVRVTIKNVSKSDVTMRHEGIVGLRLLFYADSVKSGEPLWELHNNIGLAGLISGQKTQRRIPKFLAGETRIYTGRIFNYPQAPLPFGTYFVTAKFFFWNQTVLVDAGHVTIDGLI